MDTARKIFEQGREHVRSGRIQAAAACFAAAVAERSEWVQARYNLAWSLARLGRTGEAEAAFRAAIQCNPGFCSSFSELMRLLNGSGRYEDAIAVGVEGVAIHQEYLPLHNNLGWAYENTGELVRAEHHYREALRINPQTAVSRENLARVLSESDRWKEAEEQYRLLTEQCPHVPGYYGRVAVCLMQQDKLRYAEHYFRAAREAGCREPDTTAGLGLCLCVRALESGEPALLKEGWACVLHTLLRDFRNPIAREILAVMVSVPRPSRGR